MKEINAAYLQRLLNEESVLVTLDISMWGGTKTDRGSAEVIARNCGGDADGYGNAVMKLLPKDMRSEVTKARAAVGTELRKVGIPMMGAYLVRVEDYADIRAKTDREIGELELVMDKIIQELPALERRAQDAFGTNYYDGLVPSAGEIRSKFKARVIPTSLGMPAKLDGGVRERIEADVQAGFGEAFAVQIDTIKELAQNLREAVENTMSGDQKKFSAKAHWNKIDGQVALVRRFGEVAPGLGAALDNIGRVKAMVGDITSADVKESETRGEMLVAGATSISDILANF